jgi:hypothetical protein
MAMNDAQRKLAHAPEGPHAFAQPGWFTDNYRLCAVCGCRSDHPIHAQADAPDSAAPPCACEEPHLRGRHTPQRCYVDMEQPAAEADAPDSAAPPTTGSWVECSNRKGYCDNRLTCYAAGKCQPIAAKRGGVWREVSREEGKRLARRIDARNETDAVDWGSSQEEIDAYLAQRNPDAPRDA